MCDLKKLLGIALLFYLPQCLCMEPKDECELTEVKVVVDDDSNPKEGVSIRMPVVEQRRSASLNDIDGSHHNSPRNVSPRSFALEKRRSVSEADLFNINSEELAKRAAQITVGDEHPQFHDVEELCSQELAKMSLKKVQPPTTRKNSILRHKTKNQPQCERERQEDIDQSVVPSFDPEYARAFQNLATAPQDELCKRSSTAVNVSKWMFTKAFESRSQAIEAGRDAVREKEKTARMKNLFAFLTAVFGGATTITTGALAYLAATHNCGPCEVCEVCQNIINGTISS